MRYYVFDEEGNMMRCFRWKHEALAFLQDGWTIQFKKPQQRNLAAEMYAKLGPALI